MSQPASPPASPTSGSVSAEHSPLGKAVTYRDQYAPELLFPIPRQGKRDELGIAPGTLPFFGEDLWNAYELSWLDPRGKPVVALGELRVPAASPCLIESKSLKLYFNSFNQSRFASAAEVEAVVARDLSAAAGAPVSVSIQPLGAQPPRTLAYPQGVLLDGLEIEVDCYQPTPELLRTSPGTEVSETLYSHLLKSNCLVTGQPDWGMLVVRYRGAPIDREALLRYVISFRQHNEFHEQCVERVFMDVQRQCRPSELAVWARYTRRGGLDINPFRASGPIAPPDNTGEIRQ
ncbi:NADPH-dependent 7-cyano-7-deazaguanine reductase QueF [Niveibacterium sp. SC-1]|uniref:NADPH-dependent 7-cyano-7-deazaguanine reductase QueF n=1 Tax=Niveibacterium sp. SC-1 TaxID=3135646 RepID=UPI00311DE45E